MPAAGAVTEVSIFIASKVSSTSPDRTGWPTDTTRVDTTPGMGAATWFGSSGSARSLAGTFGATAASGTAMTRGCPLSSKKTSRSPRSSASPTAIRRMTSAFPASISTVISWPGVMP